MALKHRSGKLALALVICATAQMLPAAYSAPQKKINSETAGQQKPVASTKDSPAEPEVLPGAVPLSTKAQPSDLTVNDAEVISTQAAPDTAAQKEDSSAVSNEALHPEQSAAAETTEAQEKRNQEHAAQNAYQHYEAATKYFRAWDLPLAEIEYDEAIRYQPEMKAAHRDVCLISLARLNPGRAMAEFLMVVGLGDPIPLTAVEGAVLDNKAMHAHYKRALRLAQEGKLDVAVTELKWALLYSPHDYAIHRSLAFVYASQGNFDLAEREYERTFADEPTDGVAHADFANMLVDRGQIERAENEMKKAVALTPQAAAYHIDLGWIAEKKGDYTTAANEFQSAVELSPRHANLWEHLGRLLEQKKDRNGAAKAYAKAVELDPRTDTARQSLQRLQNSRPGNNETSAPVGIKQT